MGVVPVSSRRLSVLFLLVMGAALGCGASAAPLSGRGAVRAGAQRTDRSAEGGDGALSIEGPKVDSVLVRLTVPERRRGLDARIAELTRAAEETGYTDLALLIELSGRQIERGALGGEDANRDLTAAESNLSRILAIDEHSPT